MLKLSTIKSLVIYIIDSFFLLWWTNKKRQYPRIAIIKVDRIGDYILFRNFFEVIKNSEKYKNYSITYIGNESCKEIAELLDKDIVDKFIWIKHNKFVRNLFYRYKKLIEISSIKYTSLIHPTYSREFQFGDSIVRFVNAANKIGFAGDNCLITKFEKQISDKFYDELTIVEEDCKFEFLRNKQLFEACIKDKIGLDHPFIDKRKFTANDVPRSLEHKNYISIFIGASSKKKKYPLDKLQILVKKLVKNNIEDVVLLGGIEDKETAEEIIDYCNSKRVIDFTGKTSIFDLLIIIRKSVYLISNDTCAVHFAAALEIPSICILGGWHIGRFIPYASFGQNTDFFPVPIYHKMDCFNCNLNCKYNLSNNKTFPCINKISEYDVLNAVKELKIKIEALSK